MAMVKEKVRIQLNPDPKPSRGQVSSDLGQVTAFPLFLILCLESCLGEQKEQRTDLTGGG